MTEVNASDAAALEEALTDSFNRKTGFDGRSKIYMEGLEVAGVPIPKGTLVWFTKLNSDRYGHDGPKSRERSVSHAVISLNVRDNVSITLDGSFTSVKTRGLKVPA